MVRTARALVKNHKDPDIINEVIMKRCATLPTPLNKEVRFGLRFMINAFPNQCVVHGYVQQEAE